MKKINGYRQDEHYNRIDLETGEMTKIDSEYTRMSRRPGIAKKWWEQFKEDTYKDYVTLRGIKMKPPKFYDACLEKEQPERMLTIKERRALKAIEAIEDGERLMTKQFIKLRKIQRLERRKH